MIRTVKEIVTSIRDVLGRDVSFEELKEAIIKGFEESFKIKLIRGDVTEFEEELAQRLKDEIYSRKEWNFKR